MYVWCMEFYGRQFWCMEVNPGVFLVPGIIWQAISVYGGQSGCMFGAWKNTVGGFVYGGQPWCMFGAWKFMVGSFGLWRSNRVYVWCMELYGRQFRSKDQPGCILEHGIIC